MDVINPKISPDFSTDLCSQSHLKLQWQLGGVVIISFHVNNFILKKYTCNYLLIQVIQLILTI